MFYYKTSLLIVILFNCCFSQIKNRINFHDESLFLNGVNVAWIDFAEDIGPGETKFQEFEKMFDEVQKSGGNAIRFWLHTNATNTPAFNEEDFVIGPGENAISDLKIILDLAWEREIGLIPCLWSFDMLRKKFGETSTTRAKKMLSDTLYTKAYIKNSLVPMVTALKDHPAIIAWEIFNEPEGMSNEHGWDFNYHVPMSDIQRFINLSAAAIHRNAPGVHVTNGCWAFIAGSDIDGNHNYYTDDRLISAGGDKDGYLDFYTIHYYNWAGTKLSPFHHPASYWGLDKPIVVAEFFINDSFGVEGVDKYKYLYENGYAGSLSWQWNEPEHRPVMIAAMKYIASKESSNAK